MRPLSWDQHLLASISSARKLAGKSWAALAAAAEAYAAAKLAGGLQKSPPRASDLLWAGLGMGLAMLALGLLVPAVRTWPVVGQWHQQVGDAAAACPIPCHVSTHGKCSNSCQVRTCHGHQLPLLLGNKSALLPTNCCCVRL